MATSSSSARAPPPPFGLPPWAPGAAPPVPGPVFSRAFQALILLMLLGCVFLCLNLRDQLRRLHDSDIGEDNELLTRASGTAQWLKGIQRTDGRCAGSALADIHGMPKPKRSSRKDPLDAAELAMLRPSAEPKRGGKRGKPQGRARR